MTACSAKWPALVVVVVDSSLLLTRRVHDACDWYPACAWLLRLRLANELEAYYAWPHEAPLLLHCTSRLPGCLQIFWLEGGGYSRRIVAGVL